MQKNKQFFMKMGESQPLKAYPASQSCKGKSEGAGYICGSDSEGNGFVVWIEDDKVFQTLERVFKEQVPSAD